MARPLRERRRAEFDATGTRPRAGAFDVTRAEIAPRVGSDTALGRALEREVGARLGPLSIDLCYVGRMRLLAWLIATFTAASVSCVVYGESRNESDAVGDAGREPSTEGDDARPY